VSFSDLTARERNLLTWLVLVQRNRHESDFRAEVSDDEAMAEAGMIEIMGGAEHENVAAKIADLDTLEELGFIRISGRTLGDIEFTLRPSAFKAVDAGFQTVVQPPDLDFMMDLSTNRLFQEHAEMFRVYRSGSESHQVKGLKNPAKGGKAKHLICLPDADLRAGDRLVGQLSGDEVYIVDVERLTAHGKVFSTEGYYVTSREYEQQQRPAVPSVSQNFHGPVGAVNFGGQITSNVNQRFGLDEAQIVELLRGMREAVSELPADSQGEVREYINDLEVELREPAPKPSRIKSCLMALYAGAGKVADFAIKIKQVAEAYGIDLSSVLRHMHG
jgi:hypothetical protein